MTAPRSQFVMNLVLSLAGLAVLLAAALGILTEMQALLARIAGQ
jgi:hypothetical protein